jgi:signal transduction histidine kinase
MTMEMREVLANAQVRWLQWIDRAIFNEEGEIIEYQSSGRDVTDLKRAQASLQQTNVQLQQLTRQLITAQEEERQHIARELHDEILGELGAMVITLEEGTPSEKIHENYQHIIDRLRHTIYGLRPPMLNFGLRAALEELVEELNERPGCQIVFQMDITSCEVRFDSSIELHFFRFVQQACENALRHASPTQVRVFGEISPDEVYLAVEDNGVGFEVDREFNLASLLARKQYGLAGMMERAALIGARVDIDSKPKQGTLVSIHWQPSNLIDPDGIPFNPLA